MFSLSCPATNAQTPAVAPIAKLKDEMRQPWQGAPKDFIRHWLVLGEFPNPDGHKGMDIDYLVEHGGEAHIQPTAGMTHKRPDGSEAVWTDYNSDVDQIDFLKALNGRPTTNVVAYAFTTVQQPKAGNVLLALGSDDGVSVWVNGKRIHYNPVSRGLTLDEDQVEVAMNSGPNQVLVKVDQGIGGWAFALRITDSSAILRPVPLKASVESVEGDTLTLVTNTAGASGPVRFEVLAPGGNVIAQQSAPRGTSVAFGTANWPKAPYDIKVSVPKWQALPELVFVPWYKGDTLAALKELVAVAPKPPVTSVESGYQTMLADLVTDRMKGKLQSLDGAPLPVLYNTLMENAEWQEEKKGQPGPIHSNGFVRLAYQDDIDGSIQFCRSYLPTAYDTAQKWPLIVELHGAGDDVPYVQWGDNDTRHTSMAIKYNVIVVEPHGRGNTAYQGIGERDVLRCLQLAKERFPIDDDRVYLRGMSMGGNGTWYLGSHHPELFAAIAPVAGAYDYHVAMTEETLAKLTPLQRYSAERDSTFAQAEALLNLPIYVNHGDDDQSVKVDYERYGVRMLQRWGYDVRYHEHPGEGHWLEAVGDEDQVVQWFLRQKRDSNPAQVRVRAADLGAASAYWVKVEQRAEEREFMEVDAEVMGPNSLRLDTANVLAVTLSPGSPLVDPSKPLRVSWNRASARTVSLKDGHVTLYADGYAPAAKHKTPALAGPMFRVMETPFAVVVGTIAPDDMTRQLCQVKAQEYVQFWKGWQNEPIRFYKDTEISDTDLAKYSLILIGGPEANAVARKFAASLPLKISGSEISIDGHTFHAPDAAVSIVYPHPLNPERYVLLAAASSPAGMFFIDTGNELNSNLDFMIEDGAVANARRNRPMDKVRVAGGLFDSNWQLTGKYLEVGDPTVRAKSPMLKVLPDLTTTYANAPALNPAILEAYTGEYQIQDMVVTVANEGGFLVVHVPNAPAYKLFPETETDFSVPTADVELTFVKGPDGKVTEIRLTNPNQEPISVKKTK